MSWAEHSEEIAAPIETCFAAITDYESFPGWQDAVDSIEVLDRTAEGIGHNVRLFVDAKVRKIDYVLAYRYERPTKIEWDFVEGNGMNAMDGAYSFEELGPERTRATYNLGADPAIPLPGMVMRRTHKQLVKRSVEDLRREAERRHSAGEGGEPAPEVVAEGGEPLAAASTTTPQPPPDDWVPKAAREAPPPPASDEPRSRRPSRSGHGSPAELPGALLEEAASTGRELAEGAVRAGVGAAGAALGVGREVADGLIRRVNRKLGADRGDDSGEGG